jgi:hypothetical protein
MRLSFLVVKQSQFFWPIAETSLCAIALTACTLLLTASCPSSRKITHRVSLVDCGEEFAASCKLPKGTLDTKPRALNPEPRVGG